FPALPDLPACPALPALFDPPREPFEVPAHLLPLEHRLVEHVSAARIDVEFHGLAKRLKRTIELPCAADRDARIALAVLDEKRRRNARRMREGRMRRIGFAVFPRALEILHDEAAALGQIVDIGEICEARAGRRRLEPP